MWARIQECTAADLCVLQEGQRAVPKKVEVVIIGQSDAVQTICQNS